MGIGTGTPSSKVVIAGGDVVVESGFGRFKGWNNGNVSGPGAELGFSAGFGYLGSYDRTLQAYQPLRIYASSLSIGHSENYSDFNISSSGNVGIGTISPANTLQIGSVGSSGFGGNQLAIGNGSQAMSFYLNESAATWYSNTNFALVPSGTGATGNVGIGTTNPQGYKLYVNGPAYSTGGWQGSDRRFKEDFQPVHDPLKKVLEMEGVSYKWKSEEFKDKGFPDGRHYGVIAQEIEEVLPEVVNTAPDGTKAVAYTEIVPVLIEAIKEQQKIIEKQQQAIEKQQVRLERLERGLSENEVQLNHE